MLQRPKVIIKCALSLDGFIGSASSERLILSNAQDFEELDALRAEADALMVGANTLRLDNPRLLVKSESRQAERVKNGRDAQPTLVSFTSSGKLEASLEMFKTPGVKRLIYCPTPIVTILQAKLAANAEVVGQGTEHDLEPASILSDLSARGLKVLLIEGGEKTITRFLSKGLVDVLELSIAPRFVGKLGRARFVSPELPQVDLSLQLESCRRLGDMAVLRYQSKTL